MSQEEVRVEIMAGASRCRGFNARGRQCAHWTCRTVVVARDGQPDYRRPDCGRHDVKAGHMGVRR